jgi:hypothetical protein
MSSISNTPTLIFYTPFPNLGADTTIMLWTAEAMPTSYWPTPTVLMMITSNLLY